MSAFTHGAQARYREELIADGMSANALPEAHPYSYFAPLIVEGYPGRLGPIAYEAPIIDTLAGADFPSLELAREVLQEITTTTASSALSEVVDGPYRLSVLWTPNTSGAEPGYYGLIKILRDLTYWRGILFGAGALSPITFHFTTQQDAAARHQDLIGPGVPLLY